MSVLQLINALTLQADYIVSTRTLVLRADGQVPINVYGFQFTKQTSFGGLIYRVEAWGAPVEGLKKPYSLTTDYPNTTLLPGMTNVLFITKNYPNGTAIPIKFIPGPGSPPVEGKPIEAPSDESSLATLPKASTTGRQLSVLYKEPFQITQSTASVAQSMGSISIQTDSSYLILENASFDNNEIIWTFKSLQTGNTQIKVTITGGLAQYVVGIVYDVRIFVLDDTPTQASVSSQYVAPAGTNGKAEDGAEAILSYLGRAVEAYNVVTKEYHDAQFYLVSAKSTDTQGVTALSNLTDMDVIFNDFKIKKTITINSHGFDNFHSPSVSALIVGNAVLDGIPSVTAEDALTKLRKAGHTANVLQLDLLRPLYPGATENLYNFTFADGTQASVPAGSQPFPIKN